MRALERPDAIAYTAGPGLVGALMVGGGMAAGLGIAWGCPVVPVHHMEGHLLAPMLEDEAARVSVSRAARFRRPLHAHRGDRAMGDYEVARHDARRCRWRGIRQDGEAARSRLSGRTGACGSSHEGGDASAYNFPRPMLKRPGHDFSFSGLKTAVMIEVRQAEERGRSSRIVQVPTLRPPFSAPVSIRSSSKSIRAARSTRILIASSSRAASARTCACVRKWSRRFPGDVLLSAPRLVHRQWRDDRRRRRDCALPTRRPISEIQRPRPAGRSTRLTKPGLQDTENGNSYGHYFSA